MILVYYYLNLKIKDMDKNNNSNNKNQKNRVTLTNLGCGCAGIAVILIIVLFIILTADKISSKRDPLISRDNAILCAKNMLKINTALNRYSLDHDGERPTELNELAPYLYTTDYLYCPMMFALNKKEEYIYTPDSEVILLCDKHHRGDISLNKNGKAQIEKLTLKNLIRWQKSS